VEITRTDQRIFTGRCAWRCGATSGGGTNEELKELLDEIRSRPGLVWVAIFDPKGKVIAAGVPQAPRPHRDDAIGLTLRSGTPASSLW
jgi:hypothetical protein